MLNFKRITNYTYNDSKKVYTYFLEDRQILDLYYNGYNELIMLQDYLHSQTWEEPKYLCLCRTVNLWLMYLDKKYSERNITLTKSNSLTKFENEDIDQEQMIEEKKESKMNHKMIKNYPYFSLIENHESPSDYIYLVGFSHNEKLKELFDIKLISLAGLSEGFEVLKYIFTCDWVTYYNKLLEFKLNRDQSWLQLDQKDLFI